MSARPSEPAKLEVSSEHVPGGGGEVAVVSASGEVDLSNANRLAQALQAEVGAGVRSIVLDLTAVPFMDSSGLRVILVTLSEFDTGLILVIGQDSPVQNLLELTDLLDRVPHFSKREAAIAAVTGGADGDDT